jgi:2-dehydropantoate 2-reductase
MEVREPDRRPGEDVKTVAVLGPGAVGGVFAVPLALAGFRVTCVGRPEAVAAIRRDGLTLVRRGEELCARPHAVEVLDDDVDLLLVTVKAPTLDDALERIGADAAVVVPLLNGLEHVHRLRALLGGRVVAASVGRLEAFRDGPTTVAQTTGAPLVTLAANGELAAFFEVTGAQTRTGASEAAVLWEKVARLAPLAVATALTQRSVGDLREDPDWRPRLEAGLAEACAIAAADRVELDEAAQWAIIDAMPPDLITSTARDVAAGRPSELDAITGAVVRAGLLLDVPAPTLEGLLEEAEERCRPSSR